MTLLQQRYPYPDSGTSHWWRRVEPLELSYPGGIRIGDSRECCSTEDNLRGGCVRSVQGFWKGGSASSSDGLVQICVTLSRGFSHKTAAFFTEQCTSSSLFSMFEVTRGDSNRSLKNHGFLYDAIFSLRVRMRTNHLATKCNYYARLLN